MMTNSQQNDNNNPQLHQNLTLNQMIQYHLEILKHQQKPDEEEEDDDDDDYNPLKAEYLQLLEDIKSKAMSERRRLPKLKNDKNLKKE